MATLVQVNVRFPDYEMTGNQRRFIVDVSDDMIDADLRYGDASTAKKCFAGAIESIRKLIDENRQAAETAIASRVATEQAGKQFGGAGDVAFGFRFNPPRPTRAAVGQIGGFPVWEV